MKTRYQFLDVYRGIVVLLMIEGHVVRELLEQSLQNTASFRLHELFHGITGPGFLFGAGVTFGISAQLRWSEYLGFTTALWNRLKKIVLLLGIAYALHLPYLSLSKTLSDTTADGWRALWGFDVLQCIGFSLLILQLTVMIIRRERWFALSLAVLMLGGMYSAPIVWKEGDQLPGFLSYALSGSTGSVYPLIPHAAFLFAGALVSYEFMRFVKSGREAQFIKRLMIAGVTLHAAGLILDELPFQTYQSYDYWSASPNFFLIKLGGIWLLMSGAWFLNRSTIVRRYGLFLRWLIIVGVESLFVYVMHLIVLYGSVVNPDVNVSSWWLLSMRWGGSMGIAAVFTAVTVLGAWLWSVLKSSHPVLVKGLNWWMGIVLIIEFVTRSY